LVEDSEVEEVLPQYLTIFMETQDNKTRKRNKKKRKRKKTN